MIPSQATDVLSRCVASCSRSRQIQQRHFSTTPIASLPIRQQEPFTAVVSAIGPDGRPRPVTSADIRNRIQHSKSQTQRRLLILKLNELERKEMRTGNAPVQTQNWTRSPFETPNIRWRDLPPADSPNGQPSHRVLPSTRHGAADTSGGRSSGRLGLRSTSRDGEGARAFGENAYKRRGVREDEHGGYSDSYRRGEGSSNSRGGHSFGINNNRRRGSSASSAKSAYRLQADTASEVLPWEVNDTSDSYAAAPLQKNTGGYRPDHSGRNRESDRSKPDRCPSSGRNRERDDRREPSHDAWNSGYRENVTDRNPNFASRHDTDRRTNARQLSPSNLFSLPLNSSKDSLPPVPPIENHHNASPFDSTHPTSEFAPSSPPSQTPAARWKPTKKLTFAAMDALRALHRSDPKTYDKDALSEKFGISYEAVTRILRSKFSRGGMGVEDNVGAQYDGEQGLSPAGYIEKAFAQRHNPRNK